MAPLPNHIDCTDKEGVPMFVKRAGLAATATAAFCSFSIVCSDGGGDGSVETLLVHLPPGPFMLVAGT